MPDERINFILAARDQATATVTKLKGELGAMGGAAGGAAGPLGRLTAVTGGLISPTTLALGGVAALAGGFAGAATNAIAEEKGVAALTAALVANDPAAARNIEQIEATVTQRQKLAFADDEQRESLASLVSVTKDANKALELQRVAMDLARLKGMDLRGASELIGKVFSGNLGILSRYGIVLEKGTTATEALAEIQRRASGQAQEYADSTGGSLESARLAFDDVVEDIGGKFLPILRDLAVFTRDEVIPVLEDMVIPLLDIGDAASAKTIPVLGDVERVLNDMADGGTDALLRLRDHVTMDFAEIDDAADALGMSYEDVRRIIVSSSEATGDSIEDAAARITEALDLTPEQEAAEANWLAYQGVTSSAAEAGALAMDMARVSVAGDLEEMAADFAEASSAIKTAGGEWVKSVEEVPEGIRVTLSNGETIVTSGADAMMGQVGAAVERAEADAYIAAASVPGTIAQAFIDNSSEFEQGLDLLKSMLDDSSTYLITESERASLEAMKARAAGMSPSSPGYSALQDQIAALERLVAESDLRILAEAEATGRGVPVNISTEMGAANWMIENEADEIAGMSDAMRQAFIDNSVAMGADSPEEFAAAWRRTQHQISAATGQTIGVARIPIDQFPGHAGTAGSRGGASLAHGITDKDGVVRTAAQGVARTARNALSFDASAGGASIVSSWINGMTGAWGALQYRVADVVGQAATFYGTSLPTRGALTHPWTGGESIVEGWFEGMLDAFGPGIAQLQRETGSVSDALTASAVRPELAGGSILSAGGGGYGPMIVINIDTFYGTDENIDDLSRSLARELRLQGAAPLVVRPS